MLNQKPIEITREGLDWLDIVDWPIFGFWRELPCGVSMLLHVHEFVLHDSRLE